MIRESIRNKMVCVYTDTIIKQKKHYTDKNVIFFCSSWDKFFFLLICIFSKYSIVTAYSC